MVEEACVGDDSSFGAVVSCYGAGWELAELEGPWDESFDCLGLDLWDVADDAC